MKKMITEYRTTSNSFVYNRARKYYLESEKLINCAYCPYHKNENGKYHNRRDYRNWKRYRKTQYKVKP